MLQYNFTLPILAAGAAATYFALEQEKAFVHVAKVYGDTEAAARQFRKEMGLGMREARKLAESYKTDELEALDKAFTAISEHYGVQKKEVNEVAGAWAAAGASGLALAESVNTTMKAIIIGDMNAMDATKALISIQAQYNLNTQELYATLANLNSVENQTGASMGDLIIGFEKAAGVARSAGIETQQLAAYMAALVPATGSAATAGNALKTIFSRLLAPTKETTQVLGAMGINVKDLNWQSSTINERLQIMAEKFQGLGKAAQGAASSVIASRWQVNRFEVLMRELVSTTGYYAKALEAADDQGESFKRMQEELNTVLDSSPRKLERMMVMLQNASVEIIQPLIPHIIYLADKLAQLAQAFANLSPETQKLVLFLVLFLAAVGPVVRYAGALVTLFGVLGHVVVVVVAAVWKLVKAFKFLLSPFKMLGTIATGALGLLTSAVSATLGGLVGLFSGAFASYVAITATGWAAQVGIWRASLIIKMALFKVFVLKFTAAMTLAQLGGATRWASFWAAVKLMTITGMATQFVLFRKFMGIIAIMNVLGSALVVAWTRTWAMVGAVNAAGWALIKTQWIVGSIMGIGIWSRFRTAFVVLHATAAAAAATIWRGFALVLLSTSKAAIAAFLGIFTKLIPFLLKFGKFLVSPWTIAALAIMGVIYAFRDQITQVWNNIVTYLGDSTNGISRAFYSVSDAIVGAFNQLPGGVQRALVAVVTVVRDAALAVYEWFSYINPFARHSPSLVENVTQGMDTIVSKFATLGQIKKYTSAAYAEIKRFGELTAKIGMNTQAAQQKDNRKSIKKAGGGGEALQSYDKLTGMLNRLQPILKSLEGKIASQEAVVQKWQNKVDSANAALERQQDKLDKLNDKLSKYQDALQSAQADLDRFANAPLVGMQAMEDQIFANQMAQTKLRLEMMNMEDAVGTFDDIKDRMESINGLQEIMRGEQSNLRAAGAGSDILNQYDSEISKLEDQKVVYTEAAKKVNDMQVQLEKLQREAEKLDLVKAMKFDELQYQIDKAADSTKELTFDEIMSGIAGANAEIAKYGPLVDEATKAVEAQQKKVEEATATRDRYQERLDAEQNTLAAIKARYDEVNDAIRAIETSINDVVSAAEKMNDALAAKKDAAKKKGAGSEPYISPGLQNFLDAGKADFPDPGGKGIPPRSDWSNQAGDIDKFTEQLGADTADMFASINPFKPLKAKAIEVWNWVKDKAKDAADKVGEFFGAAFTGVGGGDVLDKIKSKVEPVLEFITRVARDIAKPFKWAYELLWPQVKKIGEGIWNGLKDVWERVGPKLMEFKELWVPIGEAIKSMWDIAKPILGLLVGFVLVTLTGLLSAIGEAIGPAIEAIGTILGGLIDLVKGVVKIIVGIFTADLGMILDGVVDIFEGMWGLISGIFGGGIEIVWNFLQGFVEGVYDFFVWLYDKLVGNSIVPDIVDGIVEVFKTLMTLPRWIWNNVLKPVYEFFVKLWTDHVKPTLSEWWENIKSAWDNLKKAGQWVWENVLKPVKDWFVGLWVDYVKPALAQWWENIKSNWAALLNLGQWVWNNVLQPVFGFFRDLWPEYVKPKLGEWWENIKNVWSDLTKLGDWISRNVMDPVKNAFTSGWQAIKQWFLDNSDILTKPVSAVVNTVLGAVNAMIRGLNKVSDVLPGVEWNIGTIATLAQGGEIPGRSAARGFVTKGARAIVGEGKANYPEFVIPTDPTHRNRAKSLLSMAAQKMGMDGAAASVRNSTMKDGHGIPMFSVGGWLGDAWSGAKNLGNKLADLPKDAVGSIMNKALDEAAAQVNKIGWQPAESPPEMAIGKLRDWVAGTDDSIAKKLDSMVPTGGSVPVADPSSPGGQRYWGGGLFTNRFVAHMEKAEQLAGSQIGVMQGGFRPKTSYSGTSHQGDALDMQVNYSLLKALRQVGIASGDRTGMGDWAPHIHAVPGPSAGYGAGSATGQWADYMARGGASQSPTSPWGLKSGGIARRGSNADVRVGDGRYDEAVVPLPYGWQNLREPVGGNREFHFHGDLSFPNITDPNDAELFIQNLEILAKD